MFQDVSNAGDSLGEMPTVHWVKMAAVEGTKMLVSHDHVFYILKSALDRWINCLQARTTSTFVLKNCESCSPGTRNEL